MKKSFPSHYQLDSMDCGPSCLRIIAAYYGRKWSLATLRDRCHITKEGVSMLGISDAAESIGFRTMGVKIPFEQLCEEAVLPCIVHWNQRHFVVVHKIRKHRTKTFVYVSDPASGLLKYTKEQFLKSWISVSESDAATGAVRPLGIALLLEPSPAFYKEKDEERRGFGFMDMLGYLRPYKRLMIRLFLCMAVGSLISLVLPFLTQSVIDDGIGGSNLRLVILILIAQMALILGQLGNDLIRSRLMLYMTTHMSISLISDFLAKLMRLPISFFDSKMVGDIMQRIGDHGRIQNFLTGSLLGIVIAVVTLIVYSVVMATYDLRVLGIFLLGSTLYVGWVLLFLKRRRKLDYIRFQAASANQSNVVQLINGMQEIKLNGCEKQKRWEWERIQKRLFNISVKGLILSQTQQVGGVFINQAKNVLISFLAATAVIKGDMTLGMMTAMQYILGQLNAPISQFIHFVQEAQDAKLSVERLGEIQGREDEESVNSGLIREIPDKADIEFCNVDFQYNGPHSEKVLSGVSIVVPHDKVTAIVGASGSGKTTMLKMMLGFYEPVSGKVLLNGRRIGEYSPAAWRSKCGTVMQDGFVFSDSIANNIGVSDEPPDMERVRRAAHVSNIDEFIDKLPLKYNTKIGAEGNGISSGQRQRMLIARAAYKDSKYLFLDEATNSLDAENERIIMTNLSKFFEGRTVVVVAHRLSTVKNADNIIVLNKGKVVEQGTHKELTLKRGYYYSLVKNQLELGN